MRVLSIVSVLMPILMAGCVAPITYDYSKEPDPRKVEFVIGPSDALKITVWKNPDLSTEAKVRPDGTVTMPLVGDIRALGRTPTPLQSEITRRLATYVKEEAAQVTVAVTEVNSYRFTVSGNVEHPGIFTSKYFVTAAEAVALAGGINRFAAAHSIVIVRTEVTGRVRKIPIDYTRISSGEHPEENLALMSGDTLFVP